MILDLENLKGREDCIWRRNFLSLGSGTEVDLEVHVAVVFVRGIQESVGDRQGSPVVGDGLARLLYPGKNCCHGEPGSTADDLKKEMYGIIESI